MIRDMFTNLGRLMALLGKSGGKMKFSEARKQLGTQVYTSVTKAIKHGLVNLEGDYIILTEKGKKIAEAMAKCYDVVSESER